MVLDKKICIVLLAMLAIAPYESSAQLSETIAADNRGHFSFQVGGLALWDKHALYEPHRKHGIYPSFSLSVQRYDFKPGGLRHQLDSDLWVESIYLLIRMAASGDWKDPDGRFGNTSYFGTALFEYVPLIPVYTNYCLSTGIGGVLHDLNYAHYLYDENGEPDNPNKSDVSQYGFYGGWSVFVDAMIKQSLTLHTDFYYSYGFYNGSQKKLKEKGEPQQPFHTWKVTSTLLYENGLFLSLRYHQVVNRTTISTAASRFNMGIGYRFGMWK